MMNVNDKPRISCSIKTVSVFANPVSVFSRDYKCPLHLRIEIVLVLGKK